MNPFEKEYYDNIYLNSKKYSYHYKDMIYFNMWDYVSNKIINSGKKVIELGCGVGHLSNILFDKKLDEYIGIDFSEIAIKKSTERVNNEKYIFILKDLNTYNFDFLNNEFIIVSIETFEHLEDDLELIKKLPKIDMIFSVPNYKSINHYRIYENNESIENYYKDVLIIKNIKEFKMSNKNTIFVVESKIK